MQEHAPTEAVTGLLGQNSYASEDSELLRRLALTSFVRQCILQGYVLMALAIQAPRRV